MKCRVALRSQKIPLLVVVALSFLAGCDWQGFGETDILIRTVKTGRLAVD